MIIDVHTHIYNEERYKTYFEKAKGRVGKVLVLAWYKYDFDKFLNFTLTKDNLFPVSTIIINSDIKNQLKRHDKLFAEKKIYGIKLYPGYQHFYPSDEKIYPIVELCQKHNKPLVFHSGDIYDPNPDGTGVFLKYAYPLYIDELAVKFPECKIVISHFGFPYLLETGTILSKNKNVYTEISGTIDESFVGEDVSEMVGQYASDLRRVLAYYPNIKNKVMFGTDYGGENSPLRLIDPYIEVIEKVFSTREQEDICYKTAQNLYGI